MVWLYSMPSLPFHPPVRELELHGTVGLDGAELDLKAFPAIVVVDPLLERLRPHPLGDELTLIEGPVEDLEEAAASALDAHAESNVS